MSTKILKAGLGAAASIGASAKKMDFSKFAKVSSKSGGGAADLAKKAAKKSDDAAGLAKTAAKKSDDAADLSKKAAKTTDDAADLSKNAAKTADDVADLGKKSKKLSTNAKRHSPVVRLQVVCCISIKNIEMLMRISRIV